MGQHLLPTGRLLLACVALAAIAAGVVARDVLQARPGNAEAVTLAAPANDNFFQATTLGPPWSPPSSSSLPFQLTLSTAGATLEQNETAPCAAIGATVWFRLVAESNGSIEIDSSGSDFDTVLAAYTYGGIVPSPPGGSLISAGCNDNAGSLQARLSIAMTAGTEYFIQAGGAGGSDGTLRLRAQCNPACPPRNDQLANAAFVYVDQYQPVYRETLDTSAATLGSGESRACGNMGATVWYRLYAPQELHIDASANGSDFTAVLAVHAINDFAASPPGGFTAIACSANSGDSESPIRLRLLPGREYWFQAGGIDGATGNLTFTLRCDPSCPPYNDNFNSGGGFGLPFAEDIRTEGATLEPGEPRPCGGIGATVWYQFYAWSDFTVALDTAESGFDTVIAIYEDPEQQYSIDSLRNVGCTTSGGGRARATLKATAGRSYMVQIGGAGGAGGLLHIEGDCEPSPCPPYHDNHLQRGYLSLPDLPITESHDTRGATLETGEPRACGNIGRTVWYDIYSPSATTLSVDTADSSFAGVAALYAASEPADAFSTLRPVACADGSAGATRMVQGIEANVAYVLQVGGRDGAGGDLQVAFDCPDGCPLYHDNIAAAYPTGPGFSQNYNNHGATLEPQEPQPCGGIGRTVWYRFYAYDTGGVTALVRGSGYASVIAAYAAEGFSPPGGLKEVDCHASGGSESSLAFDAIAGREYLIQVGGVNGAYGPTYFEFSCSACAPPYGPISPDTGGSIGGSVVYGTLSGPDTGSGGYLPGARAAE